MDDDTKIVPTEPTVEELATEKKELEEVKEDDIREKIAEELGINSFEQEDLLDRAVKREIAHRKKLSATIGQKISWREKALKSVTTEPKPTAKEAEDTGVRATLSSMLEEERLNDMDVSDELKAEIKKIADINKISVKKASQDPYVLFRKKEIEDAANAENATISRKNRGVPVKFDPAVVPDFDVSTPEGQKQWKEWKQKARHQGK